jgi:DTW domain-containing protein
MLEKAAFQPRAVCTRCLRPQSACYCEHLPTIDTATHVVLLQHPRERYVAVGTARMASLCLPNSELHVGVHWRGSKVLDRALSDPARPAVLLYPGEGAIDVLRDPPRGPVTLIVVDGTWWQAKKVVRENPDLAALPRYAFYPPSPSGYRIRREPSAECVSTIEALVYVLGALEKSPDRFRAMLEPFRAMVDVQIDCAQQRRNSRPGRKGPRSPKPPPVPRCLCDRTGDLVCVVGEANAWPYRYQGPEASHPEELVQWAARRIGSGETFDFVLSPTSPLSPGTPRHIGLTADRILAGGTIEDLLDRWKTFVRDNDVICSWGRYATSLFAKSGGHLPLTRVDLRDVARAVAKSKVGTLEAYCATIGVPPSDAVASGRAGVRLSEIAAIAQHFGAIVQAWSESHGSTIGQSDR